MLAEESYCRGDEENSDLCCCCFWSVEQEKKAAVEEMRSRSLVKQGRGDRQSTEEMRRTCSTEEMR
ncbi:hypothetical protein SLEP1_g46946 [Rubroshorea leprosula]|uniref:Uncharacterized protein n=1 Tax=Rubroshorea leprosula TaxID=152421 RepID=A0AAV5LRL3_9ROSI|nr:hypothetical protein SLEP1_g46946 [Rubroshorea leprosula]